MSRGRNWAESFDNTERLLFRMGRWTLTEDGDQTKSLYFDEDCVESVLEYNRYHTFENGFLLYCTTPNENSYALYYKNNKQPVFEITGENVSVDISKDYVTFISGDTKTTFDISSLIQININDENQIGIEF